MVITVGVVSLKWLVPFALDWIFRAPFRMKGKVLSGATVTMHEIKTIEATQISDESEDEDKTSDSQFNWYLIDVTITPQPVSTGFRHWEPGELSLIRKPATADTRDGDPAFRIASCKVFMDEGFVDDDDGAKYFGPLRLQLHAGIQPGIRNAQFLYYFERFGDLTFED